MPFQYTFRSDDITTWDADTRDLLENRDRELELYSTTIDNSFLNLNASNLTSGTVPSARMTGAYTGITGLGALTSLDVQATTGTAVRITNTGTGNSFLVEDSASTDSTPFVIDAAGLVGVGTTSPIYALDVYGTISTRRGVGGFDPLTIIGPSTSTGFSNTLTSAPLTGYRVSTLPDATGTVITTGNLSSITSVGTLSGLTVTGGTITTSLAPTSDGVVIYGNGTGSSSRRVNIQPASLTASQSFTLPNASGTAITTGNLSSITSVGTLASGSIPATLLTGVGAGIGCDLVKTQAIGSGVSSVVVTGAFSSTYDMYRIFIQTDSIAAGGPYMTLQMGSTTTGYYWGAATVIYSSAAASNINNNNTPSWNRLGPGTTGGMTGVYDLLNPWKSEVTVISGSYADPSTAGSAGYGSGFLNNTTSYTSFTIGLTSSTMTGGSIRIYGFK